MRAFCRSTIRERPERGGSTFVAVAEPHQGADASSEKARRREAQAIVGAYHRDELRALLEHVREGFARLDAHEIDEFELDDLIHRYKRAAKQLWIFCGTSGRHALQAATAISTMRDRGEDRDWWSESARRQHQTSQSAPTREQPD